MKKQNIHKYILKESVVSNIMPSSLFGYKSVEKKRSTQYLRMNAREKKEKLIFVHPICPDQQRSTRKNKRQMWQKSAQFNELKLKGR